MDSPPSLIENKRDPDASLSDESLDLTAELAQQSDLLDGSEEEDNNPEEKESETTKLYLNVVERLARVEKKLEEATRSIATVEADMEETKKRAHEFGVRMMKWKGEQDVWNQQQQQVIATCIKQVLSGGGGKVDPSTEFLDSLAQQVAKMMSSDLAALRKELTATQQSFEEAKIGQETREKKQSALVQIQIEELKTKLETSLKPKKKPFVSKIPRLKPQTPRETPSKPILKVATGHDPLSRRLSTSSSVSTPRSLSSFDTGGSGSNLLGSASKSSSEAPSSAPPPIRPAAPPVSKIPMSATTPRERASSFTSPPKAAASTPRISNIKAPASLYARSPPTRRTSDAPRPI